MKSLRITSSMLILLICSNVNTSLAEAGLGAGGGLLYPGFQSSKKYNSRYGAGFGFDLMIRHTLITFDSSTTIDARYAFRSYYSDIDLPSNSVTRFSFNYLVVGLTFDAVKIHDFQVYGGLAAALITAKAQPMYVDDITETLILPEILTGIEWELNPSYNLFSEFGFQFGSLDITSDILPITGIRWMLGATMFLTIQD